MSLPMQPLLKSLIAELRATFFKPNGFTKQRQRFRRVVVTAMHEIEFQSSQWNSSDGPITFYVNVSVGFTDIPMKDGKPRMAGSGRIDALISKAPSQFDLTPGNHEEILRQLLSLLPLALSELPKHYDDVRTRAKAGWYTPIPLPATWRAQPH
jgi:hypothetical protein